MSSAFLQLLDSPLTDTLGWTVLHSLWQGVLLLLLLQLIFRVFRHHTATQKYIWAYSVLCVQFLSSVLTFVLIYESEPSIIITGQIEALPEVLVTASPASDTFGESMMQMTHFLTASLPLITSIWLLGMLFFLLRLAAACYYWEQLRHHYLSTTPAAWQQVLDRLKVKMNIRRSVELKCSEVVNSPLLIGQFRPLILLPVAMVNQLTIEEVEAILAHELAHLRRYDYALNVLQLLIEAIFYYHPANWWIGKQVRTYRELASDDLALDQTGEALVYAKALLAVAEQPFTSPTNFSSNALALGWLGSQKEELLTRIKRILNQPDKQSEMREKFAVTSLLVLLAVGFLLGAGWPDTPDLEPEKASIEVLLPVVDTLPFGTIRLKTEDNGEEMDVTIKDQAIQELSINGEDIPPADFPKYQARVEKMLADVPPPPPPPPAPGAPAPPAPPAPPSPPGAPAPPPPPAPPAAPGINDGGSRRYIIQERTIDKMEEDGSGERTIIVEVEEMEDRSVSVDSENEQIIIKTMNDNGEEEVRIINIGSDIMTSEELEDIVVNIEADEMERVIEIERIIEETMEEVEEEMREVEKHIRIIEDEEMERVIEIEEEIHRSTSDDWLGQQLLADGLTESANNFNFKLNIDRLKVNGKTQSAELHERYMKLYETHSGKPFTERTSIHRVEKMK
ncbi:MAG: M56 family metallopeptidase [Bacteroidota bacterium]